MIIKTESGKWTGSARAPYGKWLRGWKDGGGWTGWSTLDAAWKRAQEGKPSGCSWYAYGLLMAREQAFGRALEAREWKELLD